MSLLAERMSIMLFAAALSGCQTAEHAGLASKEDYRPSRNELTAGHPAAALAKLPVQEHKSFIRTVERGWLALLASQPITKELTAISQTLEERKTLYLTKEAKQFFFKDIGGNYLPAEHEVIFLHIVSGLSFAVEGRWQGARIEARRASRYLEGHFGDHAGDFDDPALRILLASLWLYCGEWQHARVDLRMAAKLSPDHSWLGDIADQPHPPQDFAILLRGVGPEVVWNPGHDEARRWDLEFVYTENKRVIALDGAPLKPMLSAAWYLRHLERDPPTRTFLDNTRHAGAVTLGIIGGAIVGIGAVVGAVTITAAAAAVSIGLIAVAGKSSADLLKPALQLSGYMIGAAVTVAGSIFTSGTTKAEEIYDDHADESAYYRYVRFLPSAYYPFLASEPEFGVSSGSQNSGPAPALLLDLRSDISRVRLYYLSN